MYNVTIFGLELTINPIAFTLPIGDGWDIYWYGILIALGFMGALIYAMKNAKRFSLNTDRMLDVALVATPLAILGARAYYILFKEGESFKDFFDFSSSGFQGLAIYGGVIVAFLSGGLMCYIRKVNILDMFDIAAIGFLIGQGVGRWGNFVNQEAFGSPTGSDFWGMMSENTGGVMVHPCFLYESLWCFAGVILLHIISKKRRFKGQIVLSYGVWYGFGRGFIELLRSDSLYLGVFKVSSLLSFVLCFVSLIALAVLLKKNREIAREPEYVEVFDVNDAETNTEEEKETAEETKTTEEENEQTD
ncbi:MAG: prolipoprotein diacylglyceryl transferase [Ruminococcaceae bacterium]|nr:prolipoprotein diacylglyceryl transferase [Oscillospiraceae bacterium]